ncbi:sigma-70 family RNA polymerase sigma factor [Candidatus Hydrogenedentota bacterium]
MSLSDRIALKRWTTQQDAQAFREIVRRHAAMVYSTCLRILKSTAEAEDVAQECFEALALATEGPDVREIGPWLHGVATNRSLKRIRSEARRKRREAVYVDAMTASASRGEPYWKDIYEYVDEAIAELPDDLRLPVVHHFLYGRSHAEISRTTGIPRRTISNRIKKGLESIGESLKKRGVSLGAATLGTLLADNLVEASAIPASLTVSLGKLALSHAAGTAAKSPWSVTTIANYLGGFLLMKKGVICVVAVVAIAGLLGVFVYQLQGPGTQEAQPTQARESRINTAVVQPVTPKEQPEPPAPTEPEPSVVVEEPPPPLQVEEEVVPQELEKQAEEAVAVQSASVSGYVMDDNLYGLAGARIDLFILAERFGADVRKTYRTETDADGAYEISDIDTFGKAEVYASLAGYCTTRYSRRKEISLSSGRKHTDINFTLTEGGGSVAGWVMSEQNELLPGAFVSVMHYGYSETGPILPGATSFVSNDGKILSAITGEDGYFEIVIPEEGLCDFNVVKEGYGVGLFTRIPTGTDDAVCVLRSPGAISGKVRRPDGRPLAGVTVTAQGEAAPGGLDLKEIEQRLRPGMHNTVTDEEGNYLFEGLSEDYVYIVMARQSSAGRTQGNAVRLADENSPRVKRGVSVHAGQTTSGIDLTLAPQACIYGTVTDAESGLPVHPVGVTAKPTFFARLFGDDDNKKSGKTVTVMTNPDGSYNLPLVVDERTKFNVSWHYRNFAFGRSDDSTGVDKVSIKPGEEKQLDFTVTPPGNVPVRFVYPDGTPRTDVKASIRRNLSHKAWWAGAAAVDAEGRAMLRGLPPGIPYQVGGRLESNATVGASEVFTVESGETLPKITVVCPRHGGIEGVLTDAQGERLSEHRFLCRALLSDGTLSTIRRGRTNMDGEFTWTTALPEGECQQVFILYGDADNPLMATFERPVIVADEITDLGVIKGESPSSGSIQDIFPTQTTRMPWR